MSGTFLEKLVEYGKAGSIKGGAKGVLRRLHVVDGKSPDVIAKSFGVSSALVRVRLKDFGVYKLVRPVFEDRVKAARYEGVDDFFLKNGGIKIADMGAKVGLSFGGIQHHYRRWLAEKARRKSGGKKR